jgi:hypothetical protein
MSISSLQIVIAVLFVCLAKAVAYTWSMNCPTPDYTNPNSNSEYRCCNYPLDLNYCNPYASNGNQCAGFSWASTFTGDVNKYSIGGSKTHTYHVSCGGNTICGAKWGHSGGTIDCMLAGGAFGLTDSITYSCHNSAFSATGHVWMESVTCVAGSSGCGPCQM